MKQSCNLPPGVVMLDLAGTELTDDERRRLAHPQVGGVILFARNYHSPEQLAQLTQEIHAARQPSLLIAVDQEGGRVQRFREGFTALPAMRELGALWEENPAHARQLSEQVGYVLAAELRTRGVNLSFTPVLDVDYGHNSVIGDRSFHGDPYAISELALSLIHGLKHAGMASVGKHFPGHGHVAADSHHEIPVDGRRYAEIETSDLVPFSHLIGKGLDGVMPAHVIYPAVDDRPAGFSEQWLKQILRERMGFSGIIFSDDLSMRGAQWAGNVIERATAALTAGCDMVLVCNDPAAVDELLASLDHKMSTPSLARLTRMYGHGGPQLPVQLAEDARYREAVAAVRAIGIRNGELLLYR